jgi:hypothetical protein
MLLWRKASLDMNVTLAAGLPCLAQKVDRKPKPWRFCERFDVIHTWL